MQIPLQSVSYLLAFLESERVRESTFNISKSDNVAVYWGQNSYGAAHPNDSSTWQKPLNTYCQDDSIDIIPIAFLNLFTTRSGLPGMNLANSCSGPFFPGTELLDCSFMASQIEECQANGKILVLSIGGATGAPFFANDTEAQEFADQVWNLFLGGSSNIRPFGDAILDGVDLDIEAGSPVGLAAFVNRIRGHAEPKEKRYYVTAAPQCPFPDYFLGEALDTVPFDAVFVQFYNNYCGLDAYGTWNWNFETWDNWAKKTSVNKHVKIYLGAPASITAANKDYVEAKTLGKIAKETRQKYSSFGGVMLWDASQSVANDNYHVAIKQALQESD